MIHILTVFILTLISPDISAASQYEMAQSQFMKGEFRAAREAAQKGRSADAAFLACRSGLIIGGFYENGARAVQSLHQALVDCEQAVLRDPGHRAARLSLALAIAFEGKRLKKAKHAKTARKIIELLVEEDPTDPVAMAALGGWHSEVAAAGTLARMVLGARNRIARQYFSEAFAGPYKDLPMQFEYAKFLARHGKEDRTAALLLCDQIIKAPPSDAFDALVQEQAESLKFYLKTERKKKIIDVVKNLAAFDDIEKSKAIKPYRPGLGLSIALGRSVSSTPP